MRLKLTILLMLITLLALSDCKSERLIWKTKSRSNDKLLTGLSGNEKRQRDVMISPSTHKNDLDYALLQSLKQSLIQLLKDSRHKMPSSFFCCLKHIF
jgi:hypothetical protein